MFSSKVAFEEFVPRILRHSPLTNPFLTLGGWQEVKCVYWNVSVGLKCVFKSRIDCSLNLLPLYITVSRNTVSESEISAVNLIAKGAESRKSLGKRSTPSPPLPLSTNDHWSVNTNSKVELKISDVEVAMRRVENEWFDCNFDEASCKCTARNVKYKRWVQKTER